MLVGGWSVVVAMVMSSQSGGRRFLARCGRWWFQIATYVPAEPV